MLNLEGEINALKCLDHPNILKLYEYFEDEQFLYLITELCKGGELFDKLIENEYFSEKVAAKLFRQMMKAINYCHK